MRILFVDDEPAHAEVVVGLLRTVLDARTDVVGDVQGALHALGQQRYDLLITDLFLPVGAELLRALGPRGRRFQEHIDHLGGLLLLDELDRRNTDAVVLLYTAATERPLLESCGDRIHGRIPKPSGAETILRAVLEALDLPVPG